MGPGLANALPSRPRFAWDIKSPPWTDGKGNQEQYRSNVIDWKKVHDSLPDANPNKIALPMQGLILKSQLYGQAADLCAELTAEQLAGADGVTLIVNAVYQRDALSVISEAYEGFNSLLNTRRGNSESLKNFELRFSAAMTKFNSLSQTTKLPQCITALMLLSNSNIDQSQRVSVLAAAAPANAAFDDQSTNDDFLEAVTYKQLASVVKQCERANGTSDTHSDTLNASSAGAMNRSRNVNNNFRGNRTAVGSRTMRKPSDAVLKRLPCHTCGKFGHWKDSHGRDGNLAPNTPAYNSREEFAAASIVNMDPGAGPSSQNKKKTMSFNMAQVSARNKIDDNQGKRVGPLVDDGAPYSAIGYAELMLQKDYAALDDVELEPIPDSLDGNTHWQYGVGEHASAARRILGSVPLTAFTDSGREVTIRHLVLEGSSQWVIGKNVTKHSNILHLEDNALQFCAGDVLDKFSLVEYNFLSYIPMSAFDRMSCGAASSGACLSGNATSVKGKDIDSRSWPDVKKIVDKVHKHVCGHANLTDMRLLLERNDVWNDAVDEYLSQLVDRCASCRHTAPPQPSRKVSISSLSKEFNDVVAVDHFFLEGVRLFHCMDMQTRFSAATVVNSTSMDESVQGFYEAWLSHFWIPPSIQGDKAFVGGKFREMMDDLGVHFRLVPPRRHSKNPLESKHGIIRSVFLRLRLANPDERPETSALRAVSISNDLYGNDVMSSFEMAKGFTKPVDDNKVRAVPEDILDAQNKLAAKRKLALILKTKATCELNLAVGDMIEVYRNTGMNKSGTWSTPKMVLAFDKESHNVTVPGKRGTRVTVAIEDVRLALPDDSLANSVQRAIDSVDNEIEDTVDEMREATKWVRAAYTSAPGAGDADFSGTGATTASQVDDTTPSAPNDLHVGDRIQVLWPQDSLYYPGQVNEVHDDGQVTVLYDDGDTERLTMEDESWNFLNESFHMAANTSTVATEVIDKEPEVLKEMMQHFGNKSFLMHQANGFEQFPLVTSYQREEESFLKNVRMVPRDEVPADANVIGSHTLYKLKMNDDDSLKLKARIAPHGNEDDLKDFLASDCTTCPPTGLRILESTASLMGWKLKKADAKTAFLQTGPAGRQVYVIPPRESRYRGTFLWLLLTAAYGLVNSNAKWQMQSDNCFFELGMLQCHQIPQLFYRHEDGKLVLLAAKVVDDIKVAGEGDRADVFIKMFNQKFELGTVVDGPGKMRFFGINTLQNEDYTIATDAEDKLQSLVEYDVSRSRRKEFDAPINAIERAAFASTNSSLGWIGTAASPFCSFYSSYLQQKAPNTKVSHIVEQQVVLRKLKKLGTIISYPRPTDPSDYQLTVLVFSDASRMDERGQLGVLTGLLVGEFENNAIFHTSTWLSFVSKRPVKNVPAAEIFAAGFGIDSGKAVAHAYSQILNLDVPVRLCVDSKDLFTSLSTQRNSIDRSIRGDVASIRYEFQVGNVSKISWIPGKMNLADVLTKKDSPLTEALQLTLFNGRLTMPFDEYAETKSAEKNYG